MSDTNNNINTNISPNKTNGKSNIQKLCAPAVIYLVFSLVQIIIDLFKGLYNQSFFKFIVMIIFTLLLNALCAGGLGIISWLIVFVPFMLMSLITAILLFVFGLDPSTGQMTYSSDSSSSSTTSSNPSQIQTQTNTVYVDPRQKQVYEDEDYNPDDFYSGTPAEINHYNNTIDPSNINKPVGTDCASKNMKTCGSTGPNVCYPMDANCPGVGTSPTAAQSSTSTSKSAGNKSLPGALDLFNSKESSYPSEPNKDSTFYGSNDPNDPNDPVPKSIDGPITSQGLSIQRSKNTYNKLKKSDGNSNPTIGNSPPPPGTTSVEKFIENMNLSFRY